jgi:NADPH:quinone reductase-like Zn-dependent oxidoreductase
MQKLAGDPQKVAKHLGAYIATTVHTNDVDRARELGADVVIDFTQQDFADVLSGYDVVLDSLGPASLAKSLTVLKPGGLAISVVGPPDPKFADQLGQPLLKPVMALLSRKIRRQARKLGVRYSFFFMRANGSQLAALAKLYDDGTLLPVVDRAFPVDRTLDAMAYVEQGKAAGKIVVTR